MKGLRFRMTEEQHAELSRTAAANGRSLQKEIEVRVFGGAYGMATAEEETLIALRSVDDPMGPPRVLAAGEPAGGGDSTAREGKPDAVTPPSPAASSRALPEHRADPKDKAEQEHGKKERKSAGGMCEHRVPLGTFCKRCAS